MHSIDDYDVFIKVVLVGDCAVGKTNITSRLVRNEFDRDSKTTVGAEFVNKQVILGGQVCRVQIWDTAGQERFNSVTKAYYRGAAGAIVVYDVTQRSSFDNVKRWLGALREQAGMKLVVMLVGNKTDLAHQREVSTEAGRALAEEEGLLFMETSAADGSNVELAFNREIAEIFSSIKGRSRLQSADPPAVPAGIRLPVEDSRPPSRRRPGCCG